MWTLILIAFSLQWFGASWLQADTYDQTVIAQSLAMAVIFLSFVVLTGMTGQVSLMQASFVTAGGFAAGWALTHDWGWNIPLVFSHGQLNFFWALVIGGLGAAALGRGAGVAVARVSAGVNFALGTLAWAFFLALVPWSVDSIRNGESGWTIRSPTLDIPGLNWVNDFLVHQLVGDRRGRAPPEARLQSAAGTDPDVPGHLRRADAGDPRADALGDGPGDPRDAQLRGRGRSRRGSR